MDNITVSAGAKRVMINDNQDCVVEFNPTDVVFIERFYAVYQAFNVKQVEYLQRSGELDAQSSEVDADGIPVNMQAGLDFVKEICSFARDKVDYLFGEGTSQKVFGNVQSIEMIGQFLEGISPYIQQERQKKIRKYTRKNTAKKSKAMK